MRHRLGPAFVVILLLTVLSYGCSSGAAPEQAAPQQSPAQEATGNADRVLPVTEPLLDPAYPGIALNDALAQAGRQVPLPEATAGTTAGTVAKVLFFPQPTPDGGFDLAILYSSGVKLHVGTDQYDLDSFAKLVSTREFQDGADHLVRETIGGRDVVICKGRGGERARGRSRRKAGRHVE